MIGATYRQVDYWARTWMIPDMDGGVSTGSGHRRRWTDEQVYAARILLLASRLRGVTLDTLVRILSDMDLSESELNDAVTKAIPA